MLIKEEKGLTGVDIAISVVLITVFIAIITNLIANININSKDIERKAKATSYAVQEIEKIKAQGYKDSYNDKGITNEDNIIEESDIKDGSQNFTGYHKKVLIKDYVLVTGNTSKQSNLVKEITVEISYKLAKEDKNITISTYISKY